MLSDAKVRAAKPAAKPYRLQDSLGLHLYVSTAGGKAWRWRYQKDKREVLLTLGRYPEMSLGDARKARDQRREQPDAAPCPTLSEAIVQWHADQEPLWKPHHAADVLSSLRAEIEPTLGKLTLDAITPRMLLAALRVVQDRGAVETAHRLRQRVSAAFQHAIAGGADVSDPAASLAKALKPVVRQGRRAALTELAAVQEMLARAEAVPAHPVTRLALRLLALTALRPGELRSGEWVEVSDATWTIPGRRMKHLRVREMSVPEHLVPLSIQAIEAMAALRGITAGGRLMFPNPKNARVPLSENALGYLLNRAGYHGRQTAHGFRATFSTLMNDRFPADQTVIDLMLAHQPHGAVEAAYNRAQHMERRRALAQEWADLVTAKLGPAAELLELPRR